MFGYLYLHKARSSIVKDDNTQFFPLRKYRNVNYVMRWPIITQQKLFPLPPPEELPVFDGQPVPFGGTCQSVCKVFHSSKI